MKILDLQKKLQEMYERYGDIDVSIQDRTNGGEYCCLRNIESVEFEGEYLNEMVILS